MGFLLSLGLILQKRMANDKKKKRLCKALNYILIEVKYDENITEQLVIYKSKGFS